MRQSSRQRSFSTDFVLIGGSAAFSSYLTYLMDPERGARRRSMLRDKLLKLSRQSSTAIGKLGRDLDHRLQGLRHSISSMMDDSPADDNKVRERVRSTLGRVVTHPRAIQVEVNAGIASLRGPVLEQERWRLLRAVSAVKGVKAVSDNLEAHPDPGRVSGLQGTGKGSYSSYEILQSHWSPSTRLAAGVVGAGLISFGSRSGLLMGSACNLAGLALIARSIFNRGLKQITGIQAGRRAVDIHKDITINAPVQEVYNFFRNYENFPRFMSHIKEVSLIGPGHSRWVVSGPLGFEVSWEAHETSIVPNEVIAWRSKEGSTVQNAGTIRFYPLDPNRCRIEISMSYNPPGGALQDAFLSALGADPKSKMDDDIMRAKNFIEATRPPGDAAAAPRPG